MTLECGIDIIFYRGSLNQPMIAVTRVVGAESSNPVRGGGDLHFAAEFQCGFLNGTLTHRAESCIVLEGGDSLNLV